MPGVQSTFLAMDTEEGVEVVWNELHFSDRKAFSAHEVRPAGPLPGPPLVSLVTAPPLPRRRSRPCLSSWRWWTTPTLSSCTSTGWMPPRPEPG